MLGYVSSMVGIDLGKFVGLLRKIVTRLIRHYESLGNFDQKAVYVCIASRMSDDARVVVEVRPEGGPELDPEEAALCSYLSVEKVRRLCLCLEDGHVSSKESRKPEFQQFAGAIDTDLSALLVGVSGFTENGDEAVALIACLDSGLLSEEQARVIADIDDGNTLFHSFRIVWEAEKAWAARRASADAK